MIAYQDEAAIYLCPSTLSTYAPKGQTPVLIVSDTKKYQHLSISAFISEKGEFFYELRQGNFNGKAIVRQLKKTFHGRRKQKYTVIWDGASIHTCQDIKDYLKQEEKRQRVYIAKIPPYSPELNPTEGVWAYLKGYLLAGIVAKNLEELKQIVIEKLEIMKKDCNLIKSFFRNHNAGFI